MTQQQRILAAISYRPVCGTEFLAEYMPRYAARIHELRGKGYPIISRPCTRPGHSHETSQTEYLLVGGH